MKLLLDRWPALAGLVAGLLLASVPTATAAEPTTDETAKPLTAGDEVRLPLELKADARLVFQVAESTATTPPAEARPPTEPETPQKAPTTTRAGTTYEYALHVREVNEDETVVLLVSVRPLGAPLGPSEHEAESDDGADLGVPHRSFVVRVTKKGTLEGADDAAMRPNDKRRIQLILGTGLHDGALSAATAYHVAGLRLRLDEEASEREAGRVVFLIAPSDAEAHRATGEGKRSERTKAAPVAHEDRATYNAATGWLESLMLADGSGGGDGRERLEIRRLPDPDVMARPGAADEAEEKDDEKREQPPADREDDAGR